MERLIEVLRSPGAPRVMEPKTLLRILSYEFGCRLMSGKLTEVINKFKSQISCSYSPFYVRLP